MEVNRLNFIDLVKQPEKIIFFFAKIKPHVINRSNLNAKTGEESK